MNILFLTHFLPYPPTIGAVQRTYHLLRQTALQHTVYLVSLNQKGFLPSTSDVEASAKHLRTVCRDVRVFDIPSEISFARRIALVAGNILTATPYTVARFVSREFAGALHDLSGSVKFDCVHIDTIGLAPYARLLGCPVVLNHHNIESELLHRRALRSLSNPPLALYTLVEAAKLRRLEQMYVARFSDNLVVSDEDGKILRAIQPHAVVSVVPNGTDTDYFQPRAVTNPHGLVFAGGMGWYPNRDAMQWFCERVYPRIKERHPQVTLDIVGPHAPSGLRLVADRDRSIRVHGFVPDARPLIGGAGVYVVPLRVGGGTRMKILDAFAMGKAVVSTTVGAEGLAAENGENIALADGEYGFAQAVVRVLQNSEVRDALGRTARETVERRYSWDVIGKGLLDIYGRTVRSGPRGENRPGTQP